MSKDELKLIGERIKRRRNQMGISQKDFAKTIGVTRATFIRYEQGQHEMGVRSLALIASVLNCSSNDLIQGLQFTSNKSGPIKEDTNHEEEAEHHFDCVDGAADDHD